MASKVSGSDTPTGKKDAGTSLAKRMKSSWLGKNWQTAFVLVMIILLAFFVRAYFAYGLSVDNGFLVSGGSDSYYHLQVINHVTSTGQHLVSDPMLNYPWGIRNARPPLYDWSVAVSGMTLDGLGFTIEDGIGYSLVYSTAFWGALTIIPVFLIGNAVFGRRAGLLAGFLIALMPGHIEKTVLSNADHDAMVLFFVAFSFYFFLRSLQTIKGSKWVGSWSKPREIKTGLAKYFKENQISQLYAALAGVCVGAVAMIWTGYVYILIIILVYYIVQLLIDRFRNADSFGIVGSMFTMWAVAFLVMLPVYYQMNYISTWYDMPVILFLIGIVGGLLFCVTRDYPWVIILPTIAAITIVALVAVFFLAPSIFNAVMSGQGYLVKSNLYSTISEAQAPAFSTLVMSFGALSFWLAIIGIGYAAIKIPKTISPYFTFVVVWGAVSVYMASAAARFLFNAAPAIAVLAGWILALIIGWVKYEDWFKALLPTFKTPKVFFRRLLSFKVVIVTVLLALLLLLPNVWTSLDAAIPYEEKTTYDKQIYEAMPSFLRPSDYDLKNGTYWYLGGFSYSLEDSSKYWPAAWAWFANRDANESNTDKPAFLSWWDYGFEAAEEGKHPTVADNFQNGYKMSGSFICAQNESWGISIIMLQILSKVNYDESKGLGDYSAVWQALDSNNISSAAVKEIIRNPGQYTSFVLAHPEIFGTYATDLDAENTAYAMIGYEMSKAGEESIVNAYHEVRQLTGYDIGYFAIDGRLFPFSAYTSNIFYAPVKLSDHRVNPSTSDPTDFYVIYAVDGSGNQYELDQIPSGTSISYYTIDYKDMFYNCLLYKAFMGFSPADLGLTEDGIPGISGSLANYDPMPAWNMTHFREVYRTAYYNPYGSSDLSNHSNAWTAISYEQALYYEEQIKAGKMNGTVDYSASSMVSGVVFIQYYDGALIEGYATNEQGQAMAGIWVTVKDEYGTPHGVTKTDSTGHYSILAPFGEVNVTFSYGNLTLLTQTGTLIDYVHYNITYAQAMRLDTAATTSKTVSASAEADPNWIINGTVVLKDGSIYGKVFIDADGDGTFDVGTDTLLENATVKYTDATTGITRTVTAYAGTYYITNVTPTSTAKLITTYNGHTVSTKNVTVEKGKNKTVAITVKPATITETLTYPSGIAAPGLKVDLLDKTNGQIITKTTDSNGKVSFTNLLPGNYTLSMNDTALTLGDKQYALTAGKTVTETNIVYDAMVVHGTVRVWGGPVPYARIGFSNVYGITWVVADGAGKYSANIGLLNYTVYTIAVMSGVEYVSLNSVTGGGSVALDIDVTAGVVMDGYVKYNNATVSGASVLIKAADGTSLSGVSNSAGKFRFVVPAGTYNVYAIKSNHVFWGQMTAGTGNITLTDGLTIDVNVWSDQDFDGAVDVTSEYMKSVTVILTTDGGKTVTTLTNSGGNVTLAVPKYTNCTMQFIAKGYDPVTLTFTNITANQTKVVQMIGSVRNITGNVAQLGGSSLSGIVINFVANSKGAVNATVTSDVNGNYFVQLRPGRYIINIAQNITLNDNSSQYQTVATNYVNVTAGQDPAVHNINIVIRYHVNGTIGPVAGNLRIGYPGPESYVKSGAVSYSTYLQAGNYCLYCTDSSGYAVLTWLNITAATTYNVNMAPANRIDIDARYTGVAILQVLNIQVYNSTTLAIVNLTSNVAGTVSIYLPAGAYNATVSFKTLDTIAGYSSKKYVVYSGLIGFKSDLLKKNVQLPMTLSLNNATVAGLPAGNYHFVALTSTAINADLAVSGSIALAPGNYSVYAIDGGNNVFFGLMTVLPNVINAPSVVLSPGNLVSGTVTLNGVGTAATVTIVKGAATYNVTASAGGAYSVYLPSGVYNLTASTNVPDLGVNVTYSATKMVVVSSAATVDLALTRDTTYGAKLEWDGVEQTVEQGQTAAYTVRVRNTGSVKDNYTLSCTATGWNITFSTSTIANLTYGANGYYDVTVYLTPGSTIMVDHTKLTLKVTSTGGASDKIFIDAEIVAKESVNITYGSAVSQTNTSHVYNVIVSNTGTVSDVYNITVDNLAELNEAGWNVTIRAGTSGSYSESLVNQTVRAGKNLTVQISMVATRSNPSTSVTVRMTAVSTTNASCTSSVSFAPPFATLDVPDNGLSASGSGISLKLPDIPVETYLALGLVGILAVLTIFFMFKKGVLGRRK
ncbi:MAG: Dolichyl-monophosphooligosaccharide--protein glycosyltransferase AglB [Methanomassiliicoccales archaeon PtaU1.Bin124]|nr:MAG: Dolichyl-monophosphooligosaccharide--protein glycosyltransferase AglB [Methanomassiliicoccales archaeon PtaU1.Bin124]